MRSNANKFLRPVRLRSTTGAQYRLQFLTAAECALSHYGRYRSGSAKGPLRRNALSVGHLGRWVGWRLCEPGVIHVS